MSGQASLKLYAKVLRAGVYFLGIILVSTGAILAFVASDYAPAVRIGYVGFAVLIGAVLVLLTHQPLGRLSLLSAASFALAFIVPLLFVHDTWEGCGRAVGGPCDPAPNYHPALRVGLFAALLVAAFLTGAVGLIRARHSS